jgi:hypothetical protein
MSAIQSHIAVYNRLQLPISTSGNLFDKSTLLEELAMTIYQVDAQVSAMGKEEIEQELKVIEDVLAVIGGELIDADVSMGYGYLIAYVRAESELLVSDLFEASFFTVDQISCLGPLNRIYRDFCRPAQSFSPQSSTLPQVRSFLDLSPEMGLVFG